MATTTYEEEKKRVERPAEYVAQTYAPPTPTATYAGSDSEAMINAIRQRYSEVADPRRQDEEDARIQRGRQFWTGANLFANVIANAINANGTARNAPNMTWNNEMEKNMYATWRDADKQLRADRKEAQQRYDAMTLQDAQMRLNDKQAADKAALDAYNRNFAAQQEADKINYNNQWNDYRQQQADDRQLEKEKREDERWKERNQIQYNQNLRLANIRHAGSGSRSGSSSSPNGDHSVSVGSVDIPAKDKKEAEKIRKNVADKIVDKLNKDIEERNKSKKVTEEKEKPISKPKSDKEAQEILYQYGGLYNDDAEFRDGINSTYGIEDIYADEAVPEFEQFAGHSVRPDESSLPDPRRYAGTAPNQTPRAYRGNPVTWNTSPIRQTPHALSEGEKELLKKGGKKPKIEY